MRNVFCLNTTADEGGALRLHSGSATVENNVFLENGAASGSAVAVKAAGTMTFRHNSAALDLATTGHAALSEGSLGVADSYLGDHGPGTEALVATAALAAEATSSAWWNNQGGDWNANTDADPLTNVTADSRIGTPTAGACDPLQLLPPADSPLLGAASDGTDIGAFGGPNTWSDDDGDGWLSILDRDDADAAASPDAAEIVGDGIDQDCDRGDDCWADEDGDGRGTPGLVVGSPDLDCTDAGEASIDDDPCPLDPLDDVDLDGVCDGSDACPGFDDGLDGDGDGTPDGCDPDDPGTGGTGPDTHGPGTARGRGPAGPSRAGCSCDTPGGAAPLGWVVACALVRRRAPWR